MTVAIVILILIVIVVAITVTAAAGSRLARLLAIGTAASSTHQCCSNAGFSPSLNDPMRFSVSMFHPSAAYSAVLAGIRATIIIVVIFIAIATDDRCSLACSSGRSHWPGPRMLSASGSPSRTSKASDGGIGRSRG